MLDSLKVVDYVFLDFTDHILTLLKKTFPELKPDYYVINIDANMIPNRKRVAKQYGVKMAILKRQCPSEYKNVSTTKIIKRIKNL